MEPDLQLVSAALGAAPRSLEPLASVGYTRSRSWRAETDDGRAFVKQAEDEGSLHMLRREAIVYQSVRGPFLPGYIGFADGGGAAVLAIELLEDPLWPPPYPDDASPLFEALEAVAACPVPDGLPRLRERLRWETVGESPEPLLALGLCSRKWLEVALPVLVAAEAAVVREGDELCHGDVYSGNVGFRPGGAVLVDWGAAVAGSRWVDVAFALLSVRVEGGVVPSVALPDEPAHAAAIAGLFALETPKPPPDWAAPGSSLRADMAADLLHSLRWSADALGLPPLR